MIVISVVTFILVILTSILLSAENSCTYITDGSNEHSCPEMNYIVGVLLSVLIIELLMQITHAVLSVKIKDKIKARIMDSSSPLPESRKIFHRPSQIPDSDTNIAENEINTENA